MNFCLLTNVFTQLEQQAARNEMIVTLANLFAQAEPAECQMIAYLACGALAAQYKNVTFGLADKQLFKSLTAALTSIQSEELAALWELHGDLGAGFALLQGQSQAFFATPAVCGQLSVAQVFEALQRLTEIQGTGAVAFKGTALLELMRQLCPVCNKFVLRIITGKLRLGISEMTILDGLSWWLVGNKSAKESIEEAFNVCADIGLVAKTVRETGLDGVRKMVPMVGVPIRPAAAERLDLTLEIAEKMLGQFVAQPKLDGLRVQVHKFNLAKTPVVRLFSRNLLDVTEMFPELVDAAMQLNLASDFIAEGEAIAVDPLTGALLPFQQTSTRRRKYAVNEASVQVPLRLYLFDLLFYQGQSLLAWPHHKRRAQLEILCPSIDSKDTIQVLPERQFDEPTLLLRSASLEDYFEQQIEAGLEGIIVKRPDATYRAGKRNFNWIKLKRLEKTHLNDTIDVVILGYYLGKGKRAGLGIGALLAGIYQPEGEIFASVCKIGTGLTDQDWLKVKQLCDEVAVPEQPKNVQVASALAPDVWVTPKIVVAVRADQISRSPIHLAGLASLGYGLALRFPRLISFRADKSAIDATSEQELISLAGQQKNGVKF